MKTVIVGGGFAGLNAAKELLKKNHEVTLINDTNYFQFTPLIHEVVVGSLTREGLVQPIREVLGHQRFHFIRGTAKRITEKKVFYGNKSLSYDYLMIAIGSQINYYGIQGADENTLCLKTIKDAELIHNKIVDSLEAASAGRDVEKNMTFIVVGAGAAGVQIAGEIMDYANESLRRRYLGIKSLPKVYLLQAIDKVLPSTKAKTQSAALAALKKRGVEVLLDTPVTKVMKGRVYAGDKLYEGNTIVWCAGVKPNTVSAPSRWIDSRGFFIIDEFLKVKGTKNVFAIGDCARNPGEPMPALAQVAVQQASRAAKNIHRHIFFKEPKPFKWNNKGIIITLGYRDAVAEINFDHASQTIQGFIPWVLKKAVFLDNIFGFRYKLKMIKLWTLGFLYPRDSSEI